MVAATGRRAAGQRVLHMRMTGKSALISGGASGIGAATARKFVAEGAKVALGDVQEGKGRALAEELGANVTFVKLDVTSEASWRDAVAQAEKQFGGLTTIVNSAGISVPASIAARLVALVEAAIVDGAAGHARGVATSEDVAALRVAVFAPAEGSSLQVLLSTARRPLREQLAALSLQRQISFQHFDRIDSAIAHALERAGHLLMRRS